MVSADESCLDQGHGPSLVSHTQWLMDEGTGLFQHNPGQLWPAILTPELPVRLAEAVIGAVAPQLLPLTATVHFASLHRLFFNIVHAEKNKNKKIGDQKHLREH